MSEGEGRGITRRSLLLKLAVAANAIVGAVVAVPVIAYLSAPLHKKNHYLKWVFLGHVEDFPEGQTRMGTFRTPFHRPWDGPMVMTACWVRHVQGGEFQVFAVNCAHLGCPVRWFPQSKLFMCPCHGGVYYANGTVAAGPPPRPLYQYPVKVQDGKLMIQAGQLPTLSTKA